MLVNQTLTFASLRRAAGDVRTRGSAPGTRREEFSPSELLDAAIAECEWFLDEKGARIESSGLDCLPRIHGSRDALRSAFLNLLHNAAKYGHQPGRAARISVTGTHDQRRARVAIKITDRGPGIPYDEQRLIFKPFVRGRNAVEGTTSGSGLGLSLAREAVEADGGAIRLESRPGYTEFHVFLPTAPP